MAEHIAKHKGYATQRWVAQVTAYLHEPGEEFAVVKDTGGRHASYHFRTRDYGKNCTASLRILMYGM